jgi:glycosyltransferase involved in cell wall biosynthesis
VTFVGSFNWPSNLEGVEWFISRIWKRVIEANAELKLTLVGRKPPSGLIRRAAQSRSIEVKGFVKNIDPLLRETAVFIVPLLSGSGIRVKILDAWRWGLPVVSTSVGAEGLEYTDGEDLLIADTPDKFCRSVSALSCEKTMAQRLIHNGKKRVVEHYAWKNLYHLWDEVYNQE